MPGLEELVEALGEPMWVAEAPEAHLLPHLERGWGADRRLELNRMTTDAEGVFVIELGWRGEAGDLRAVRQAVFALVGAVAESATYVRQRRDLEPSPDVDVGPPGGGVVFEVATGMLSSDTAFDSHGHVLLIRVAGVF